MNNISELAARLTQSAIMQREEPKIQKLADTVTVFTPETINRINDIHDRYTQIQIDLSFLLSIVFKSMQENQILKNKIDDFVLQEVKKTLSHHNVNFRG